MSPNFVGGLPSNYGKGERGTTGKNPSVSTYLPLAVQGRPAGL